MSTPGPTKQGSQLLGLVKEDQLWKHRDEAAVRSELADRFLGFAKSIALRYRSRAENTEDLMQVAYVGLMNAIDRFEPARSLPFTSFAGPTINGELKRHYRDRISSIRIPRSVYERVGDLETTVSRLRASLVHEPTTAEIAEALHCSSEQVDEANEVRQSRHPLPLQGGGLTDDDPTLEDRIGNVDSGYEKTEDLMVAAEAMDDLSPADRDIVTMRFRDDMTQSEIADRCDCSQMQISRRLRSIVDHLREVAEPAAAS